MKTKLKALFDDESFATDSIGGDAGFLVNENSDLIEYLFFEFEGFFHVYLHLYDEEETPFRDILAEGIAPTLEEAKEIAINNLNLLAYKLDTH